VRADWESKPLSEVAELQGRIGWKGLTAKEYVADGPFFLSVHSLNYGDYVDFRDAFHISQQRYDESPEIMVRRDDVLICKDGAGIGKVGIVGDIPGPSTINSSLLLIRPKTNVLPKYLYFILQSPYFQRIIQSRLEGATTPHLYQRDIASFPVHLPPLEEQRRIVAVLDEALAAITLAIANAEKYLAGARALFERAASEWLTEKGNGWRDVALEQVCEISSKLVDPKLEEFVDLRHIGAGNIESRTGQLANVMTAREEGLISGKFLFDQTMVLYSKIRPYLMKACRPDFDGLCSADVYPLVPRDGQLDRDFLFHVLLSGDFTAYAEAGSARAGMPKVNRDHLFAYRFTLPPINQQQEIAERIDALADRCRELASSLNRTIERLTELKQSVLQQAFSGQLKGCKRSSPAASNENFETLEFSALVLAFAHSRHVALGRTANFGRVKAQKTLQAVEAIGGLELGRRPIKDAAGPNDFAHMLRAEEWAKQQGFFEFIPRLTGGYDFHQLQNYDKLLSEAKLQMDQAGITVKRAIELLVDMDSDWAEIVVTTHAAWNNLILDKATITDDTIIQAARDDWHRAKLRHEKSRFRDAIRFIRSSGVEPNGSAKRVGGQERLAL
jgi:restriction endonuclease S subunit